MACSTRGSANGKESDRAGDRGGGGGSGEEIYPNIFVLGITWFIIFVSKKKETTVNTVLQLQGLMFGVKVTFAFRSTRHCIGVFVIGGSTPFARNDCDTESYLSKCSLSSWIQTLVYRKFT